MVKTKKNLTNLSIDHGSLYVWTVWFVKWMSAFRVYLFMRRKMIMIYEYIETFEYYIYWNIIKQAFWCNH